MNRAPFMATPRGSTRGTVPPGTGSRRSDPGSKQSHIVHGPLGPITHPSSRSHGPNYGVSGVTHGTSTSNHGFGNATPAFDTRESMRDVRGDTTANQQKMRDNLAQMQRRAGGRGEPGRERQPLANIPNGGNGRVPNQNGGGFGIKGGGVSAVPLRSKPNPTRGLDSNTYFSREQVRTTCSIVDTPCDLAAAKHRPSYTSFTSRHTVLPT